MSNEPGARWLTTADAAKRLNVSSRTIRRRCEAGTLAARFIGGQWEVSADAIGHADTGADKSADTGTRADGHADTDLNASADTRTQSADSRTSSDGHADADTRTDGQPRGHGESLSNGDLTARLIEQLERENKRLAEANEQHQRAEAELRAALREALRAMPKQLTAGNETGQNGTGNGGQFEQPRTGLDVDESATNRQQRQQIDAAGNVPNATANGAKSPANAQETGAIHYGAICDLIEGN